MPSAVTALTGIVPVAVAGGVALNITDRALGNRRSKAEGRQPPKISVLDWNAAVVARFVKLGGKVRTIDWRAANKMRRNGLFPSEAAARLRQRQKFNEIDRLDKRKRNNKPFARRRGL